MSPIYGPLVTLVVAAIAFAVWMASRRRVAAETLGRAEEQASRLIKDAEREAENLKKEAVLEAKEKAHELVVDAERQATASRQASSTLEQTLVRRESALAERQRGAERLEAE